MSRYRKALSLLGGSLALALCLAVPAAAAPYGIESLSASLSSAQAGAHADLTLAFKLNEEGNQPAGLTRDLVFSLPPGVIGNPQKFPRCSLEQFGENIEDSKCPQDSQVGVSTVRIGGNGQAATYTEPLFNMESPGGDIVARFGLWASVYPILVNLRVDPVDYSIEAAIEGAPSGAEVISASTTIWGIPAAEEHDPQRRTPLEAYKGKIPSPPLESGLLPAPFLSNPTDCSLDREVSLAATSYNDPGQTSTMSAPFPKIGGCEKLSFAPEFSLTPTNPEAFAPTGVDSTLRIPQNESPTDNASSALKAAVVTLPAGLTINPAAGDGLEGCSAGQAGFGTAAAPRCPDAAKIGTVELDVPALERTLQGAVYQRTPEDGRLFRFWVITDEQGVRLKLPAEIAADPLTGQLTAGFNGIPSLGGNPQVPFEELRLHFFGGPRAPLATGACGSYSTHYEFSPWSGRAASVGEAPMQITTGCGKGGFSPGLRAGTTDPTAGGFAPFVLDLTRSDGEANPASLEVHLPQGLLAKLGGVPLCSDADAATGSCPGSSQIGRLAAAAGVGGAPLWIPQPGRAPTAVYLAGPYKGAPYSILAVVPAQAGPFDLGLVLNRSGIYVDPDTATATIKTDPLPQILQGVPIAYRALHVEIDRPEFTLNATGCKPEQIAATVRASDGQVATPTAGYQATNCAKLPYKPSLSLRLKGPTGRTGHPALRAVLAARPGDANSAAVSVALPHSEFLDQGHIGTICTRVQFRAGAGDGAQCPAGAVYGHARAWSPLLSEPLAGPIFLRSSDNPLPDLVLAMHGAIDFNAVGRIDSKNGGIRNTFDFIPDAPISKVVVDFQGGRKGLLINSRDLCKGPNRATVKFSGQNGRRHQARPPLRVKCGKGHRGQGKVHR